MKKRYFIFTLLVGLFTIMMSPKVFADDPVEARFKTNPSSQTNDYVVNAEKNVTTGAQLKAALQAQNVNLDDYLVLKQNYQLLSDYDIICDEGMPCNQVGPSTFASYLYLMPIDHTARSFTLKSIPATDEMMFEGLVQTNYEMFGELSFSSCNDTFTLCTFKSMGMNSFAAYDNVTITYEYEEDIKEIAQAAVTSGLLNKTDFVATDTELLHYINYGGSLADYTSEFKNQLSNLNFRFEMDQRGGAMDPLETGEIGFYKFLYNDTIYAIKNFMSVTAPHIIYVPTDATNIVEAIESRLNTLFGDDLVIDVEESADTIDEMLDAFGLEPLTTGGDAHYYILTVVDQNSPRYGMEFFFQAVKDSTKINNTVSFRSSDLLTNISVSTDEQIPLDTVLNVNQITSGEEYNKIIKALAVDEGEMFDINLYSNAQAKQIKNLGNGKFLVSIPIPEKYAGKKLIIYYVDADNKVTPYSVVVDAATNMASFETDHFSVYTLAVDPVQDETNPPTGDNIMTYIGIGAVSMLTLVVLGIVTYKNKRMKDKQ